MSITRAQQAAAPPRRVMQAALATVGEGSLTGRSLARGGVLLGLGSVVTSGFGYAYTLLLSRALGPARYGAVAALVAAGVIGAIPAVALQLVVARRVAAAAPAQRMTVAGAGLRLSLALGAGLLVATCLLAPALRPFLHLDDAQPVLWLGVSLLPLTAVGAYQGALLGLERFGRLAAATSSVAAGRLAAAVVAVAAGWGVTGVLAATAVATCVAALCVSRLAPLPLRSGGATGREGRLRELVRAGSTISGLLVLTNLDVLLARHYLSPRDSGAYAIGALFAKAAFWGAQFVPLLFFPQIARGGSQRALLPLSAALTAALGLCCVVVAALAAGPMIRALAGSGYSAAIRLAWIFALLGTAWALVQLLFLSGLAEPTGSQNALLWSAVLVEVLLVVLVLHRGMGEVLLAAMVPAAGLLGAGLAGQRRRHG